jgi:hypothetical protein
LVLWADKRKHARSGCASFFSRLLFCGETFEVLAENAIILLYGPDFFGVFGPIIVDEEKGKWEKGLSYVSL